MAIVIKRPQVDGTVVLQTLQPVKADTPTLPINLFTKASPEVIAKATKDVNDAIQTLADFKQVPAKKVHNLFEEALELSAPSTTPPVEDPYTILVALSDFAEKKFGKKVLTIVNRENQKIRYVVKDFDLESGRAKLEGGFKGGVLKPVITEREVSLYFPLWTEK